RALARELRAREDLRRVRAKLRGCEADCDTLGVGIRDEREVLVEREPGVRCDLICRDARGATRKLKCLLMRLHLGKRGDVASVHEAQRTCGHAEKCKSIAIVRASSLVDERFRRDVVQASGGMLIVASESEARGECFRE